MSEAEQASEASSAEQAQYSLRRFHSHSTHCATYSPGFDGFDVLPELFDPFFGQLVVGFKLVMIVDDFVHSVNSLFRRRFQFVIPVGDEVNRLGCLAKASDDKGKRGGEERRGGVVGTMEGRGG